MSDDILPSQIHRYELVERIAVGGMAEVFRAKTFGVQGFEKQLAVKRILPELAANREFVDRFVGEAKIAVTLNHANIVQVLDFSRFGDSLFIAMEYIDGCDLSALFKGYRKQGKTLPVPAALHIAIELLKGLDFAHGREVVHRDMSPANVLVSKSGEVKIADFGIAQAAGDGSGHTNPFQIMGKWRYMSPEQTRAEPLTSASDLFSTAIMLHEAFTGHRLFDQEEPAEIVKAIREQPLPRIREIRPELSEALDAIVMHGLERDPAKRGSASIMMRALIEFSYAQSLPVTAMDLAEVVKEFTGAPGASSPPTASETGQLIDDIINSELQHRRPGCQTRLTRITPAKEQENVGDYDDAVTGLTFVDGGLGPDGLTQWLVGDAQGGPVAIASDGDFDFSVATVSRTLGGSQVTPTQLFQLALAAVPGAAIVPAPAAPGLLAPTAVPGDRLLPAPGLLAPAAVPGDRLLPAPGLLAPTAVPGDRLLPAPHSSRVSAPHSSLATPERDEESMAAPRRWPVVAAALGGSLLAALFFLLPECARDEGDSPASGVAIEPTLANPSGTRAPESPPPPPKDPAPPPPRADTTPAKPPAASTPALTPEETRIADGQATRDLPVPRMPPADPGPEQDALDQVALVVRSTPAGASVQLAGKDLGTTPLRLSVTRADQPVALRLQLEGFREHTQFIDLGQVGPVKIRERLRKEVADDQPAPLTGRIDVFVKPWANVYFRGAKIAEAPARGIRLPHGTHKLRLENPVTGQKRTVTVEVPSNKPYRFTLQDGS